MSGYDPLDHPRDAIGRWEGQGAAGLSEELGSLTDVTQSHPWQDLTPVGVDEVAAAEYGKLVSAREQRHRYIDTLARLTAPGRKSWEREQRTASAIIDDARTSLADGNLSAWDRRSVEQALERVEQAQTEIDEHASVLAEADEEWERRGRWSRAFLVVGGDGHVHSSMGCPTCNRGERPTQFQWMTGYSDAGEEKIVAGAGWRACTVCYPTAPVGDQRSLPTRMLSRDDEAKAAARSEREQKAQARREKAVAAGLTEDGSPLRVTYTSNGRHWSREQRAWVEGEHTEAEEFKTERTATTWYTDYVHARGSLYAEREPVFSAIEEAIAAKHGKTVEQVREELTTKAQKKRR